jgi:hypothetical protein
MVMLSNALSRVLRFPLVPLALLAVPALGAQERPDYLVLARGQLSQGHRDSALVLLRLVTDSQAGESTARQVEAWVLTGVVAFYGADDSAVVIAFRRAFALDPGVQASGLGNIDATLAATFEAQRPPAAARAPAAPAAAGPAAAGGDSVYDCIKRCPAGVDKPTLIRFPQVSPQDAPPAQSQIYPGASGMGPSGMHGIIEYHFIINEAGSPEPGSVVVAMSSAGPWQSVFMQGLLQARFRPAMLGPRPVRALVHLRVDVRAEGMSAFEYKFAGP